jgi:CHAT domain-containing protein
MLAAGEGVYLLGRFDSARTLWLSALADARARRDSALEGRLLTWLGLAAYRTGDYAKASRLGEQALQVKLRAGLTADLAQSYNALGLLAWNQGRLAEAAGLFRQAAERAQSVTDARGLAKAANNLALVLTETGDFSGAREGFEEARVAGRRLKDGRIEGGALTNLAMLDIQLGAPGSAIQLLRRARDLYARIGYETGEQNALGQLGTAYDALGEPRLAFSALDSALILSRKEGLRQEEASNLELIAGLYRQAGDYRRALALYDQANTVNGELGLTVEEGADLRAQAEIHAALGRLDLARERAAQASRLHARTGAQLQELKDHLLLADLTATDGSEASAGHLRAAERLARILDARIARVELALTRATIADRRHDPRAVLHALDAARQDVRGDYGTEWQAAALRTRAYARLSRLDSAAAAGQEAVASVERVRGNFGSGFLRSSYAADKSAAYAALVDVLLRLGRIGEAFEVADAGRSRALLEHLGSPHREVPLRPAVRALADGEVLLRTIDTLAARLDALEESAPGGRPRDYRAQARVLAGRLAEARGSYEALLVQASELDASGTGLLGGRRASAEQVVQALGPDEVLLEYFVMPERLILFVATRDGVRSVASDVSLEDLSRRVRLARDLLASSAGRGEDATGVLRELHSMLIAPAQRAGMLRTARRLVVIPHSVLAYLPFSALVEEATGRFVVQDYSLLYLPSAAALAVLRADRPKAEKAPASGAPLVAFAPFPRQLPASLREIRAVGRAVRGTIAHAGEVATERRVREALTEPAVIHLATHGLMNVRNPMFSRIELAPGDRGASDDGRLEVHELLELEIRAPLVFLSGCETAAGAAWSTRFARGEDYATLAQAFLYAGAGSVLATLWRVEDEGAAAFAQRFYLRLGELPPAEALAAAQRDLLRDMSHAAPRYWAAYQLSGGGLALPGAHIAAGRSVERGNQ